MKRVFELACEGCGTGKIAKILNQEKIPTPGRYKNQEKLQYHIIDGEGYWDSSKVRKVLQNKVYLGTVVNGKNRVKEIGGRHFRQVPDEEQIYVPNRHEAIITEQEFLLASEVIKNNGCQKGKKHTLKQESILLGKLRCGHCKRSLIRIDCTRIPCFTCKRAGYEQKSRCISERLSEPELEETILDCINQKLEQEIRERKCRKKVVDLAMPDDKQIRKICMSLEQKQDSLKIEKQYLYEQFKRNQMDRGTYTKRVEKIREEENSLCEQIQKLQEEREKCEEAAKIRQEEAECTEVLENLTREVVDEWVDTIYVYGKSQFDIVYKEKIKKY